MGYWEKVRDVVKNADIVFEVLDSRFAAQSRNQQLEELVRREGKRLVLLVNKADLIGKNAVQRLSKSFNGNCVFISAKKRLGTAFLRKVIGEISGGRTTRVAFCGYPNVGKSSIINALAHKKSAGTSSRAGFTKGAQHIRVSKKVLLIDTPGVIPVDEHDEALMVMLGSKNAEQVRDLESAGVELAEALLQSNKAGLLGFYGIAAEEIGAVRIAEGGWAAKRSSPVTGQGTGNAGSGGKGHGPVAASGLAGVADGDDGNPGMDGEAFLEALARKRNRLLPGGRPDLNTASRTLINDFQRGNV